MNAEDLKYTRDHEWISHPENGVSKVGISDYAQQQLGDIVYVEFPDPPQAVSQGESCATLESVKAASDIYAPVNGIIQQVNTDLEDNPQLLNQSPLDEGWIYEIKVEQEADLNGLMDYEAYQAYLEESS